MRGIMSLVALLALMSASSGCLSTPNVFHPGTESYQQARAQVWEPYPENDMGPAVVGGRPREYQDQQAEVTRVLRKPGEPILVPCTPQQAPLPQAPFAQATIVQPIITSPPPAAIYTPPAALSTLQP
jgi:hypothetical protein